MKCEIHDVEMKEIDGKYGKFWSHETDDERYKKTGTRNLRYCNGDLPKDLTNDLTKDSQGVDTKVETARIRLKIYDLALSHSQGNLTNWIRQAEEYIFAGTIPKDNPFPPEE